MRKNAVINEISASQLTLEAENAEITTLTTTGTTNITTTGDVVVNEIETQTLASDSAAGFTTLTTSGNASIEMTVRSSFDLNIGNIGGNTSDFANKLDIQTTKSIKNGAGNNDMNVAAKEINLKAGDSIGERNKSLNLDLPQNHSIDLAATNLVNVNTKIDSINYNTIKGNEIDIQSQNDIKIGYVEVDTLNIITSAANVEVTADIKNGVIQTNDKRIVIDNGSFAPDYYATAQIHSQELPLHIGVNAGGSIDVSSKYVLRHAKDVRIGNKNYNSSMKIAITEASEATVEKAHFGEKAIDKTDMSLYAVPTVSDYISNVVNDGGNADITNIKGDLLNTENVFDAINTAVSISVTENANESGSTGEL